MNVAADRPPTKNPLHFALNAASGIKTKLLHFKLRTLCSVFQKTIPHFFYGQKLIRQKALNFLPGHDCTDVIVIKPSFVVLSLSGHHQQGSCGTKKLNVYLEFLPTVGLGFLSVGCVTEPALLLQK